ncbi:MAG: hypothetical protein U5O69_08515, partial [Candidatus Competibacteraceae bacterium]|nr:hypothetical protein [Candidatus Competibacteraceae bacterium]
TIAESTASPVVEAGEPSAEPSETEQENLNPRSRRGRRGGRRRRRGDGPAATDTDAVPEGADAAEDFEEGADAPYQDQAPHPTAEPIVAPSPSAELPTTPQSPAAGPQRRIRSGRPRLPKEMLAAAKAATLSPPASEPVAPPPTRLEYPVTVEFAEPVESVTQSETPASMPVEPIALLEPPPMESEPNPDQTVDRHAETVAGGEHPVAAEEFAPADLPPDSPAELTSAPATEPAMTAEVSQEGAISVEAGADAALTVPQADEAPVLLETESTPREIESGDDAPESPEPTEPAPPDTSDEPRPAT